MLRWSRESPVHAWLKHIHCLNHNESLSFLRVTLALQVKKFRKHMIFIWKSVNCEIECSCIYLCFTSLSGPEASFCLPAADLLAPHRIPNSSAMDRLFVWLFHFWIQTCRLGGWKVRMGADSHWRVHLLNLGPSWTMFRLRQGSKRLTLVLDEPLVGESCVAGILRCLKPSFAFFLDLSADWQIH